MRLKYEPSCGQCGQEGAMGHSDHSTPYTTRRSTVAHINSVLLLFCIPKSVFGRKSDLSCQLCGGIDFQKLSICAIAERRVVRIYLALKTHVSLTPDSGVLRDQTYTTPGPKVNCVRQVDF